MSFISDFLGPIASVIGIGSGVKDLFGGGQQGGSSSSQTYVPTGLGSADQLFQSILQQGVGGAQGAAGQMNPALMQAFAQMMGVSPAGMQAGGQQAGQISQGLVPWANAGGEFLGNQANVMGGAGQELWKTALDPQNALRDRMQQQITDASRASSSARGLGMGGTAAGMENDAMRNFMIDWQNQQLGRQATGLQGMGQAFDQSGRDVSGALASGALGPQFAQQAGQMPYQAQMQGAMQPFNAINQLNQGMGGMNQNLAGWLGQIIPYLNQGQGATGQAFNQQQAGLGNIFQGAYNLGGQGGATPWDALARAFQPGIGYGSAGSQDPSAGGMFESGPW